MRAVVLREHGGPEAMQLVDVPDPVPGPGEALARVAGARVFTTASSEDKRERARAAGAEAALDYTRPDWPDRLRELTGGQGVDLVVDHVGEDVFADALSVLANKGRIVLCGASS